MPYTGGMSDRNARDTRIAELEGEAGCLGARLGELNRERGALRTANAREEWPDGPFTLHYHRYGSRETEEHDTPLGAIRAAVAIEEYGSGSTESITDRHGALIYDLAPFPWERLRADYPALPAEFA